MHTRAPTHTHTHPHTHARTHARMHACTHAHARTHKHTHTHTNTNTNTNTRPRARAARRFYQRISEYHHVLPFRAVGFESPFCKPNLHFGTLWPNTTIKTKMVASGEPWKTMRLGAGLTEAMETIELHGNNDENQAKSCELWKDLGKETSTTRAEFLVFGCLFIPVSYLVVRLFREFLEWVSWWSMFVGQLVVHANLRACLQEFQAILCFLYVCTFLGFVLVQRFWWQHTLKGLSGITGCPQI